MIQKLEKLRNQGTPNKSRFNPQSSTSILLPSTPLPGKSLKRCQSALSIRNRKHGQNNSSLETKYKLLQQNYKKLATDMAGKNEKYVREKEDLKMLQNKHEQNQRQIRKLRGMLGFLDKSNISTQTIESNWQCQDEKYYNTIKSQKSITPSSFYNLESAENLCYKSFNYDTKYNSSSPKIWFPNASKNLQNSRRKQIERPKRSDKPERSPSCQSYKQKYKFKPSIQFY